MASALICNVTTLQETSWPTATSRSRRPPLHDRAREEALSWSTTPPGHPLERGAPCEEKISLSLQADDGASKAAGLADVTADALRLPSTETRWAGTASRRIYHVPERRRQRAADGRRGEHDCHLRHVRPRPSTRSAPPLFVRREARRRRRGRGRELGRGGHVPAAASTVHLRAGLDGRGARRRPGWWRHRRRRHDAGGDLARRRTTCR